MEELHQFEIMLILFVQSLGGWLEAPMQALSALGREEVFLLLMPTIYWCFDAVLGLRVAILLLLSTVLKAGAKIAMQSPRPYWVDPRVAALSSEPSFGMPSGHAFNAAVVWGAIAAGVQSRAARVGLVALIILIGVSRVYLGVHFASDVVLGWLIGGLLLWAYTRLEEPILRRVRALNLQGMVAAAFLSALVLAGVVLLPAAVTAGAVLPAGWEQNALSAFPDSELDPYNVDEAFTVAGTWFGMLAGAAWLFHKQGRLWNADGAPGQRVLRYFVGIIGVLALWSILGRVFPRGDDVLSFALRFLRYTLIGLWVSVWAPLIFQRLGLAFSPVGEAKEAVRIFEKP